MRCLRLPSVLSLYCLLTFATAALAQPPPGCTATPRTDPPRTVFTCAGGLVLEAETATRFQAQPAGQAGLRAVEVSGRGLLVDLPPRRGSFQILTPHAIASVRGTIYAVDVTPARTSVFVTEGRVRVSRRDGAEPVELGPGDGVDVAPGVPLRVQRWSRERAAGLMARFGR